MYVSYSNPTEEDTQSPHYSSGRLDGAKIVQTLEKHGLDINQVDYFVCAGTTATPAIVKGLRQHGVAASNIHLEFFGPFVTPDMNVDDNEQQEEGPPAEQRKEEEPTEPTTAPQVSKRHSFDSDLTRLVFPLATFAAGVLCGSLIR